ncbi:Phosphoglycolate phosphatase, HAD superfamily [Roseomonas rosea]|uniref:phosphoglycolate phosphatase n=1 Tax=Muricoccus roseus TaxID=198092 RepID=A0A1M6ABM7_9PROT|nr:HAD family hydrolase [Roseomonas rosea]SHI33865.1 Phosphoglycolate phosphatase, HAD superfamily [Roseomonas rosea]
MAKPKLGAVVFDCDGVLLVSNTLKVAVFREALAEKGFHPDDIARFSRYQVANFGTSRYRLFEHFLSWSDLKIRPDADRDALVEAYARLLRSRYTRCASTPGMREVLDGLIARGVPLFVVSGSDGTELREVFAERGLAGRFRAIHGSPATKTENLKLVAEELGSALPLEDVWFIGDAEADFKAAQAVGARFVYADHFSTAKPRMRALAAEHGFPTIRDLRGLPALLDA